MPDRKTTTSHEDSDPFKQEPRDSLRQTAGAAAPLLGERGSVPPKAHEVKSVGAIFQWPLRVYWEDTDAGGIVFYANYLKFFERARTEWLRSLGIGQQRLKEETGGMFVVTDTQLRYHRPARLDDELIVTATVIEKGRASLIIAQRALLKTEQSEIRQDEKLPVLCEGTIRIGWVNASTLQPMRIPASVLDSLSPPPSATP